MTVEAQPQAVPRHRGHGRVVGGLERVSAGEPRLEARVVERGRVQVAGAEVAGAHALETDAGQASQELLEKRHCFITIVCRLFQVFQAVQAKQGIELRHARIQPGEGTVIVAVVSIFPPHADFRGQRIIVRGDNSSLAADQ